MQPPGGGTGSVAAAQAAAAAQPAAAHPAAAQPAAAASSAGQHVRLLSWNVNGLRAALKRLNVTISQFLEGLGAADIICLQETKLRRCDIDRELAVVEGWDSFFCCDTSRATGYSGTATYVRSGVALPFAAEEGFTGCAPLAAGNGGAAAAAGLCTHPALVGQFEAEELAEMDAEGRVLVTDHGCFVLFNLYGPAITNADTAEDRSEFKMRFYRALELRWRHLLRQGRAVVAVGDFNISAAPVSSHLPV
ncbi:hypothetical protein COHA_005342 [Chlorella ohadii]|uniref:Endonuclease/exonuclease/phosphatase domain-containing protein n=1 Tax=Chlorella ohadii TaxID=2649997 RepID=A0AAD5DN69_9CHLO|nr:hypothetical protein COHA_005342 [Chlorella ohadii]